MTVTSPFWTTAATLVARAIFAFVFGMAAYFKFADIHATAGYIEMVALPFPLFLACCAAVFELAVILAFLTGAFMTEAALLAGRALAVQVSAGHALARHAGTVVLDDPRPAAYCVAGRPAAIVVTSGALALLGGTQLSAVLAHERAHLAGRHHLLATAIRGLTAAFPGVPLFARGAAEVARLSEMTADDAAVRLAGRPALVTALLAIATGAPVPGAQLAGSVPGGGAVPASGLAATACAVPARVERLLCPPGRSAVAVSRLTLAALSTLLLLVPAALAVLPT